MGVASPLPPRLTDLASSVSATYNTFFLGLWKTHLHNRRPRQELQHHKLVSLQFIFFEKFAQIIVKAMMFRTFRQLDTSLMSIPSSSYFLLSL